MRVIFFFLVLFFAGILLISKDAFVQGGTIYSYIGIVLVLISVLGLSFSIAVKVGSIFQLRIKNQERLFAFISVFLGIFLWQLHLNYFKYQKKKLNETGIEIYTKIDSVNHEQRGKLAPKDYFYYSYTVDNELYHFSEPNNNYLKNQKIIIKYCPNNPGNHEIIENK